jgi:hypothetical protein
MIMSAATIAVAVPGRHAIKRRPLEGLHSRLLSRFYRFLEELPERYEDVDPEVFKRVPVPI